MCGIAGILSPGPSGDLRPRLTAMIAAQRHRGPDDQGVYVLPDQRAGLANCRLAIRDLSPAGHMPMGNPDGTVWITYNGELYNTAELRPELEALGYIFRSHSDTEVILCGYEAWGTGVVQRLRGIFAFGLLDTRPEAGPGQLFLARDHLGVKPLYYTSSGGAFLFASELKALLTSGLVSREISPTGLVGYLLMGSVPTPHTIYRDLRMLDAGSTLSIPLDRPGTVPQPSRYWSMPTTVDEKQSEQDSVDRIHTLLEDAVRTQLVSDVPLGAFLSGGLDSSAVVALMRRAGSGPIRTCSMVFEESDYSEAPFARAMAEAAGAKHYERVITSQDVENELDNILKAMDQPSIDGVNTYFVSKTAREAGLTVSLSGLGGDELFGGYTNTFGGVPQMMRALTLAHAVPGGATLARSAIGLLPDQHRWTRTRDALTQPASLAGAYLTRRGLFAPSEVQALVSPDIWAEATRTFNAPNYVTERAGRNGHDPSLHGGVFAWTSRAELSTYTQNQLLRDTDVMSMAHSLEVRVPLLDHRLVEAVLRLPARAHRQGDGPKPLLTAALGDALPPEVRARRDKQGFVFPFDRWMRGPLRYRLDVMMDDAASSPWLRRNAVERVWNEYGAGRAQWSRAWALAVLQRGTIGAS
jgi:asparagine synthase (glutamine-hydrolysing)